MERRLLAKPLFLDRTDAGRRLGEALLDARYLGELELGWHSTTIVTAKKIADALEVPLAKLVRTL